MPDPEPSGADARVAFELILERALNSGPVGEALGRAGEAFDRERLRTQALQARAAIGDVADVRYRDYLAAGSLQDGRRSTASRDAAGMRRSGWLVAVLALVAVVAAVLLAVGFSLRAFGGRPYVGDGLITAGMIAGAVAAGAAVGDFVWSLMAATRDRCDADHGSSASGEPEGGWTREEWELALLEWGIVPFLLERIEESSVVKRRGHPAG
ncbi:hypothetical protein [Streptomyces sp. NPDC051665]|uniref:hypothetical protein n=1 Tax=Streptomyces sp. NPDC051665 TaxID=3154647 RepID=UPI003437BCA0